MRVELLLGALLLSTIGLDSAVHAQERGEAGGAGTSGDSSGGSGEEGSQNETNAENDDDEPGPVSGADREGSTREQDDPDDEVTIYDTYVIAPQYRDQSAEQSENASALDQQVHRYDGVIDQSVGINSMLGISGTIDTNGDVSVSLQNSAASGLLVRAMRYGADAAKYANKVGLSYSMTLGKDGLPTSLSAGVGRDLIVVSGSAQVRVLPVERFGEIILSGHIGPFAGSVTFDRPNPIILEGTDPIFHLYGANPPY